MPAAMRDDHAERGTIRDPRERDRADGRTEHECPGQRPKRMREAAGNLEFEEAARLRDELKRLQAVDMKISDDPFARQSEMRPKNASVVPDPTPFRWSCSPTAPGDGAGHRG